MKSLTVCVEYDDYLSITLPRNRQYFDHTLVITSSSDRPTQKLAIQNDCSLLITDVFYDRGADFNKGAAIEKGFDLLGRDGWFCIWDCDVVMPADTKLDCRERDCLYGALRRTLPPDIPFDDELDWNIVPVTGMEHEYPGYFQIFHSDGAGDPPWYSTDWKHAGGCDSDFQMKFGMAKLKRLPFQVLHLGPTVDQEKQDRIGHNWCGRRTPRIDQREIPKINLDKRDSAYSRTILNRRKFGTENERLQNT